MGLIVMAGAHRVGKTSCAIGCAKVLGIQYIEFGAVNVHTELGIKMDDVSSIVDRFELQHALLDRWIRMSEQSDICITDRSPIDFMAYLKYYVDTIIKTKGRGGITLDHLDDMYKQYKSRVIKALKHIEYSIVFPTSIVGEAIAKSASLDSVETIGSLVFEYYDKFYNETSEDTNSDRYFNVTRTATAGLQVEACYNILVSDLMSRPNKYKKYKNYPDVCNRAFYHRHP